MASGRATKYLKLNYGALEEACTWVPIRDGWTDGGALKRPFGRSVWNIVRKRSGLQVFTTCGSEEKKAALLQMFPLLDASHVGDSRSTSFEQLIMRSVCWSKTNKAAEALLIRNTLQRILSGLSLSPSLLIVRNPYRLQIFNVWPWCMDLYLAWYVVPRVF